MRGYLNKDKGRGGASPQDREWGGEGRMFQVEDPEGDTWRQDRPAGLCSRRRNKVKGNGTEDKDCSSGVQ